MKLRMNGWNMSEQDILAILHDILRHKALVPLNYAVQREGRAFVVTVTPCLLRPDGLREARLRIDPKVTPRDVKRMAGWAARQFWVHRYSNGLCSDYYAPGQADA